MNAGIRSNPWTWLVAGVIVVTAALGWWIHNRSRASPDVRKGTITVVAAPDLHSYGAPRDRNASPLPAVLPAQRSPEVLVGLRYPFLSERRFDCAGERCELSGTLRASSSEREEDQHQAMLLGGLERLLIESGYSPMAAIQMDEIGDNQFRVRLMVQPSPPVR